MNMMLMMMMMQMMDKQNNPNDALQRLTDRLDGRGQYSPAMQNYLNGFLQNPALANQGPFNALPPPTAANPINPTLAEATLPASQRIGPLSPLWRFS